MDLSDALGRMYRYTKGITPRRTLPWIEGSKHNSGHSQYLNIFEWLFFFFSFLFLFFYFFFFIELATFSAGLPNCRLKITSIYSALISVWGSSYKGRATSDA